MDLKKNGRLLLGLLISASAMWLALREVPFNTLYDTLTGGRYGLLFPAAGLMTANVLLLSLRWKTLLGAAVRLRESLWSLGAGYLFNNILPFRLGDVARVLAMSRCARIPLAQVMSTAVIERLLDVMMLLLVLLAVLPLMEVPPMATRAGATLGAAGLITVIALALARQMGKLGSLNIFLTRRWNECMNGIHTVTRPGIAVSTLGLSCGAWLCSIGMYWCVLLCFQPEATFVEAAFLVLALALVVAVPSTPGFIGVFQLVGQQALVIPFGDKYSAACALSIALTAHLIYYLYTTVLGAVGLWQLSSLFPDLMPSFLPKLKKATGAKRAR